MFQTSALCQEAALFALNEDINIEHVHSRHFKCALKLVVPRITKETLDYYDEYYKSSGFQAL